MDYSSILQELKMALWDIDKCNSSIAWDGDVYDTFMCAGYYSGIRSVCRVSINKGIEYRHIVTLCTDELFFLVSYIKVGMALVYNKGSRMNARTL